MAAVLRRVPSYYITDISYCKEKFRYLFPQIDSPEPLALIFCPAGKEAGGGRRLRPGKSYVGHFSSMERMPIGQALAQIPQAMHLLGRAPSTAGMDMTCIGQALTHSPQPTHLRLSIMKTPFAFWVIDPSGQVRAHLPQMMQYCTLGSPSG